MISATGTGTSMISRHPGRHRNGTTPIALSFSPSLDGDIGDPTGPGYSPLTPKSPIWPGPPPAETAQLGRLAGLTGRAGMIPRAEECLRKAKEAEAMAEAARDQAAREIYTSNGARLLIRLRSADGSRGRHHDRHHNDLDHHDAEYVRQPLHRAAPMT